MFKVFITSSAKKATKKLPREVKEDNERIGVVLVGTRENFYQKLKRTLRL